MLFLAALAVMPLVGQLEPDGLDISTAVPITFGQVINDVMDARTRPRQVYRIPLARGQKIIARLTIADSQPAAGIGLYLFGPNQPEVRNMICGAFHTPQLAGVSSTSRGTSWEYLVANEGSYYVVTCAAGSSGVQYRLQVDAEGVPLLTALPAQAGCLFGQVDFIEFSLRLIAMNLPDRLSIGGTEACASCTAKPPLYDSIVRKLEDAMRSGVNVEACYDDKGNIFKVKLQR